MAFLNGMGAAILLAAILLLTVFIGSMFVHVLIDVAGYGWEAVNLR